MDQSIDIEAWRRDGERLWVEIQRNKLLTIFWNNPWFRFAVIGSVLVTFAVILLIVVQNRLAALFAGLLSLPCLYVATKYYVIGRRTGGLYSFFSEKGFGIGCDADRLCIPYSAIELPQMVSPSTVNDNYIVLPVKAELTDVIIERKEGPDSTWDGTPYRRGIASVFIQDGTLRVRAYPNEMIVHLFCAIYPLSLYLASKGLAQRADASVS